MRKVIILMLGFIMLLGCSTHGSNIFSDKTFTKIELKVFGKKVGSYQFVLENNISDIQNIIDDIYVKDNYQGTIEDIDIPKGITYSLIFINKDLEEIECMFSHDYFVVDEEVYKVNDYDKTIEDIENIFDVKYE